MLPADPSGAPVDGGAGGGSAVFPTTALSLSSYLVENQGGVTLSDAGGVIVGVRDAAPSSDDRFLALSRPTAGDFVHRVGYTISIDSQFYAQHGIHFEESGARR